MFGRDLIALFAAQTIATFGTTSFLGSKAVPKSGTVLVVIETGGMRPTFTHNRRQPTTKRPSAQVSARAVTLVAAEALALAAYTAICNVSNTDVNGTHYLRMTPMQEPFDMGTDDEDRVKVGFNVSAEHRGF